MHDLLNSHGCQRKSHFVCPLLSFNITACFCGTELRSLFDLKVFVDTDADTRLARR